VTLLEAIKTRGLLIGDGGIGTELQRAGLEPGASCERWNVERPKQVLAMHRAYADAGAQLLTTNTFGASRFLLARHGLGARVAELCRAGARLARQAAGRGCWVLGSVGPCGGFLEPHGEIPRAGLEASLREQIRALLDQGVDAIIVETMTAADELELAVRVARDLGAPCVIASLAYDRTRMGYRTMMGVAPEQGARSARDAGADILGANCGASLTPEDFVSIARAYRSVSSLPLCLQPNGGKPRLREAEIVYEFSPEEMTAGLLELTQHAQIVGGCCGVTPRHIRDFVQALQSRTRGA